MDAARRLALGRLLSLTGGSAAYIALIASLYERTGSAAWVSAALVAGVAGSVAGAPAAGYAGDRFDRRRVMIGALGSSMGRRSRSRPRDRALLATRRSPLGVAVMAYRRP